MKRAGLLLAAAALACSRAPVDERQGGRAGGAPAGSATAAAGSAASAAAATSPAASAAAAPISTGAPKTQPTPAIEVAPPLERALEQAAIVAITPRVGAALGVFDAAVRLPDQRDKMPTRLTLALTDDPTALRRPLAFYRLARALGARVVQVSVLRRFGAGEIIDLLEGQTEMQAALRPRLVVQNDGTVDALLTTAGPVDAPWSAPAGRPIAVNGAGEIDELARAAASPTPLPGEGPERARLLRDYVEMLALDYLSANVLRRTAVMDDATGALVLDDNATAFPLHVDPRAEGRLLTQLRGCARFPAHLRAALARLDRARASATLAPGSFEAWLISPRSLVALEERRAGLLSLIEAKIAASPAGEAAVLSL